MHSLSGNKGEWSEIYTFLRLLEVKKLYAADADLNKIDDMFYNIINIIREEEIGELEFWIDKEKDLITVVKTDDKSVLLSLPCSDFKKAADHLYNEIVNSNASFASPDTEEFLDTLGISSIKAGSTDKADIRIKLHDINTGYEPIQGFSIKSRLGSPSTLINAGKTTNFIYEVTGNINDGVMEQFNNCPGSFQKKFAILADNSCDIEYITMQEKTFENNLKLIDGDLPKICAYMLKERFFTMVNKIEEVLEKTTEKNPLNYDLTCGHPFYEYKFKKLLAESALGMLPSRVWDGTADATGGYIIVKENGEVLCYHLFNRNEFETYLIKNTRFETASTSRHEFGTIFKENGKYYLKLNLQVRFIK